MHFFQPNSSVYQNLLYHHLIPVATAASRVCYTPRTHWGCFGFDAGIKTRGACREGSDSRKSIAATL